MLALTRQVKNHTTHAIVSMNFSIAIYEYGNQKVNIHKFDHHHQKKMNLHYMNVHVKFDLIFNF